jgi:hypothetical protein
VSSYRARLQAIVDLPSSDTALVTTTEGEAIAPGEPQVRTEPAERLRQRRAVSRDRGPLFAEPAVQADDTERGTAGGLPQRLRGPYGGVGQVLERAMTVPMTRPIRSPRPRFTSGLGLAGAVGRSASSATLIRTPGRFFGVGCSSPAT